MNVWSAALGIGRRLGVPKAEVTVRRLKWATWPDASLGCAEPNTAYAQVETEGLLVELEVAGKTHEYHAAGERVVPCHGGDF